MSVVILLTLKARPEAFEGLKSGLAGILPDTNAFAGCLGVYACADPDTHTLMLYERWNTPEDHDRYAAWRAESGGMKGLGEALREPPVSQTLEDVFA